MTFLQAEASPAFDTAADDASDADITPDVPSRRDRGRRAYVRGLDVSHHNDDIDFRKVRRAGYDFVFIKATQDNDFIDPMFLTNMARAREAGLAAGGYHFFDYTLDGRVQADHFVDRLELADAIDDALPPVVDVECWAPIGSSIHAVSAARLRDLVARLYERTGRLPIIYTSVFMWREVMGNAEGFEELPLWAACWGCEAPPSIAPGWDSWAFWQTGVDRVRGVKKLDGNVFSGSLEDLQALRLRPLTLASGAPATADREVALDLGGRAATHVRTSADGSTWTRWRPVRGTPTATLGASEGSHTVHVQLRHGTGRPSPVYTAAIELDLRGPELTPPTARLRLGALGDDGSAGSSPAVPVEIAWQASDAVAGLGDARLAVGCGTEPPLRIDVPGTADPGEVASWTAPTSLQPGADCEVTIAAADGVGNTSRVSSGDLGISVHSAQDGGASGVAVEGDQVGVIARRGPDGGRAEVRIDGSPVGLIELAAPEAQAAEVVYVADLEPGAPRTISVTPLSGSDAAAAGRVEVDAFVTLASG